MRSTLFRIREWMAEQFQSAQYPPQRVTPRLPRVPFFKHQMPPELRFGLIVFGVVAILAGAVLLFFLGILTWAALTA